MRNFLVVIVSCLACSASIAQKFNTCNDIEYSAGSSTFEYSSFDCGTTNTSGITMTITAPGNPPPANQSFPLIIQTETPNRSLPFININNNIPGTCRIVLTLRKKPGTNGSWSIIGGIQSFGSGMLYVSQISDVGNLGSVTANRILNINTTGDIFGYITATAHRTNGQIDQSDAPIIDNIIAGGSILGNISAADTNNMGTPSYIGRLDASQGVGTSASPVSIDSAGAIVFVEGNSIYANLNSTRSSVQGSLSYLRCRSGDFTGSITSAYITGSGANQGLFVAGNLNANVTLSHAVLSPFTVGGSLASGKTIAIGQSNGIFNTNMIFNAQNGASAINGSITLNGTQILALPYYSALPNTLGGGAVGLAPFHLHDAACDPANNAAATVLSSQFHGQCTAQPVQLEFYGPIKAQSAGQPVVDLQLKVVDVNNVVHWVNMNRFVTTTLSGRKVTLSAVNGTLRFPGGDYRVTPTSNLVCDSLLTPSVVPVAPFTYNFTLLPDCDVNCVADSAPCNDPILCDSIDFNLDTLYPDTQDINDFLAVFSGGVCNGQQPGDPPYNTDIDFNNDTLFPDTDDVDALLSVFGGGSCLCISGNC